MRDSRAPSYVLLVATSLLLLILSATSLSADSGGDDWDGLNRKIKEHHGAGNHAAARMLALRALEMAEKNVGPNGLDVATSLENLAALSQTQGHYAEAEPLLLRAVSIRGTALGRDDPDLATALDNLAGVYRAQGEYASAVLHLARALELREQAYGPDHTDVATNLDMLAKLYVAQGEYEKAEPLLARSIEIRETANDSGVFVVLGHMAVLYRATNRDEEAAALEQRVSRIHASLAAKAEATRASQETGDPRLMSAYRAYTAERRKHKHKVILRQAVVALDGSIQTDPPSLSPQVLAQPSTPKFLEDLLGVLKSERGKADPDWVAIRSLLAYSLIEGGRSRSDLRKARKVLADLPGDHSYWTGRSYSVEGKLALDNYYLPSAEKNLQRALRELRQTLPPDHVQVLTVHALLARTYTSMRDEEMVEKHLVLSAMEYLSDGEAQPLVRVSPVYPARLEATGQTGWVEVEFTVTEQGSVTNPIVLQSAGGPEFRSAALFAVKGWKYRPRVVDGKRVAMTGLKVRLDFRF